MTLLYVEDNEITRESTCMLLNQLFKNVIVCIDGEDGLEKFKANKIDLIITDLNMPKMHGTLMLKEIRKINNLIPAIVLTAHSEQTFKIDSIKAGASSYVNKPPQMNELFQAIYEMINHTDRNIRVINDEDIIFDQYDQAIKPNSIVTIFDNNGIILYVNESFAYMFKFPKDDIVGRPYYTLSKEEHDVELIDEIWKTIKVKKEVWSGTIRYVNNNDEVFFLKGSIYPILNNHKQIIEFVAIREDITEQIKKELKQYEA